MSRALKVRAAFFAGLALLLALTVFLIGRTIPFEVQSQLNPDHPLRLQYEDDLKIFDDETTVWIVAHRETAFTPLEIETLSKRVSDFLETKSAISSVTGPANAKYFERDRDGLRLTKFFKDGALSPKAREKLNAELWAGQIVRSDFTAFQMKFRLSKDLARDDEKPLLDDVGAFLKKLEHETPGLEVRLMGTKVASAAFLSEMQFQQSVITPLLLLAIAIFFFLLYRSWQIVAWSFFVMFVCYVSTLCLLILIEGGLGPYGSFALMFSFIVATTDLIQFFSRFQQIAGTVEERLRETLKIAWFPCLLTSLTTAAGFAALVLNVNRPVRLLGVACAFACLLEWVVIFYVLPPLFRAFNFNPGRKSYETDKFTVSYWTFLAKFKVPIAVASIALIVAGAAATLKIRVDDNFFTKFEADHPLSRSIQLFSKQFDFVGALEVIIKPKSGDFFATETMDALRSFENELSKIPDVSRIHSLRQINDQVAADLPETPQGDAERKAALNLFADYGDLADVVNPSAGLLRTSVFLKSFSTAEFDRVLEKLEEIRGKYGDTLEIRPGGFAVLRSFINGRAIHDFYESFFLAFGLIFLCFLLLYRDPKWALLALIPNAVPLFIVSGLMGLSGTPVDTDLVVLMCITFGISGDNTIHLTAALQSFRREGNNDREAFRRAIHLVGPALAGTSAVFLFCLPVFLLGHLRLFEQIAVFLSVSFFVAFLADLLMFPALQLLFAKPPRIQLAGGPETGRPRG